MTDPSRGASSSRRRLLSGAGAATAAGLAGCAGLFETRTVRTQPVLDDRPDAIYVPTHVEGMKLAGRVEAGPYRCALAYSYPHRFWTVTGEHTEKVPLQDEDSVHLMPVVWDAESGVVPPDLSPHLTISRDGNQVDSLGPWQMLSQRMGFHFGDNVALPGEGTYDVSVRVGAPTLARRGSLADNAGGETFSFTLEYSNSAVEDISYRDVPADREGTRGAVDLMDMDMLPDTRAPAADDLPGTVRGTARTGDVRYAVTTLDDPAGGGGSDGGVGGADGRAGDGGAGTYLAVSARARYNRVVLPTMGLSATLSRGGTTVVDDVLPGAIGPALGTHYGATVPSVTSGDELTVTVDAPPQAARHEGYETAFFDVGEVTLTL
ncbi:MAG: iron transporter [Halobacteriaceae archaeon]